MAEEQFEELPALDDDELMLVSPEELMQYAMSSWREEQEDKSIELDCSLEAGLRGLPGVWIDGIAVRLKLPAKGGKKLKISRIAGRLGTLDGLRAVVAELPRLSREALQALLAGEGWSLAWRLARDYGDDSRDGWFWNEELPESPLGLLRVSGLLMLGRTTLKGRRQRVAVVPAELRQPLAAVLAEQVALKPDRARTSETLDLITQIIAQYYHEPSDWQPPCPQSWLVEFMSAVARGVCADELWTIWNDTNLFLFFLEHFHHEIRRLEDLRDYHLSELVHDFIETKVSHQMGLKERRRLLDTIRRLYAELATEHSIDRSSAELVARAIKQICASQKLTRIARPVPHGGEVVMQVESEQGLVEFTLNDLWLLIIAAAQYQGDLQKLRRATARAISGGLKRRRIDWLAQQDLSPIAEALYDQVTEEMVEYCSRWFYQQPLSEERAW